MAKSYEEGADELDARVEKIVGVKHDSQGNLTYEVKWLGFSHDRNSFESREDLIADGFEVCIYWVKLVQFLTSLNDI